jgi:hypothetical protein
MKTLGKIDKYYLALGLVLLILGGLVFVTVSGIMGAIRTAGETNDENMVEYGIEQGNMDEAYKVVTEKNTEPLDLGD